MAEAQPDAPGPTGAQEPPRFSLVWLVPVVAAAVGGYLFYRSEIAVGPTIEIAFAGRHQHRRRAPKWSTAASRSAACSRSNSNRASTTSTSRPSCDESAGGLAREGSQFWIVEPRVSVGQVTGLETLLSGSYIQVAPGSGAETTQIRRPGQPAGAVAANSDLLVYLESDDAASLEVGSPVIYRGINVGTIAGVELPGDGTRVQLEVAIAREHASLVRANSVFWLTSGVHFDLQPLDPRSTSARSRA